MERTRLLCLLFFFLLSASDQAEESKFDYSKYQIIEVSGLTDFSDELLLYQRLGIPEDELEIFHEDVHEGLVQFLVKPALVSHLLRSLHKEHLNYTVISEDVGHDIFVFELNDLSLRTTDKPLNGTATFDRYMTNEEISKHIHDQAIRYPSRARVQKIGETYEGRPIEMLVISDPMKRHLKQSNVPVIFIEAGIHAREWISPASAIFIANKILHSTDPMIQNIEWRIIPVANPDGYHFTWVNNRLWRKNKRPSSPHVQKRCFGVDLNRNFDFRWDDRRGASTRQCSAVYKGSAPFSEKETIAIRNAVEEVKHRTKGYVSIHSYGQYILHPPGIYDLSVVSDDARAVMSQLVAEMADAIFIKKKQKYTYGTPAKLLYPATGLSMDWAHVGAGIPLTLTFELRDRGAQGFLLAASKIKEASFDIWIAMRILTSHVTKMNTIKKVVALRNEQRDEEEIVDNSTTTDFDLKEAKTTTYQTDQDEEVTATTILPLEEIEVIETTQGSTDEDM